MSYCCVDLDRQRTWSLRAIPLDLRRIAEKRLQMGPAIAQGNRVPQMLIGELVDSSHLAGRPAELRQQLKQDG